VGAILVAPGGTLNASLEAQRTAGAFAVDCLAAEGFRAVNLVPGDFAKGLTAIKPLLSKGPFISANLRDSAGNRLAPASIVMTVGARKVGITGVALAPATDDPSGKTLPADLTIADPIASLKDVVADLSKTSDVRILLVYGSPIPAAAIVRAYPQFQLCLAAAGSAEPAVVQVGNCALVQSPPGGQSFGVTVLPNGAAVAARSEIHPAPLIVTANIQKVYDQHHLHADPLEVVSTPPPAIEGPAVPVPQAFPTDGILALNHSASNRGVNVTATICRLANEYGGAKAAPGASLLVVSTTWENIIPLTLIAERNIPTEYVVPNLPDHLYAMVNGSIVARLLPQSSDLPGTLPIKPLKIEKLGQVLHGNLVFALPPVAIKSLELRFYDYAHGHFVMPLVGSSIPVAKAISPSQKNSVIEAAVFGVEKGSSTAIAPVPAGMQYIRIDLRARSTLTLDGDATAFDPKARKGARLQIGTVADWKESRKYAQVVVDGENGYMPMAT
jgi:hypothetical protein